LEDEKVSLRCEIADLQHQHDEKDNLPDIADESRKETRSSEEIGTDHRR